MCGIVGIIRKTDKHLSKLDSALSEMLFFDVLRGAHSTGVAHRKWDWKDQKYNVLIRKEAKSSPSFISSKDYREFMTGFETSSQFAIGHNRYATAGKIEDENAHPFQHGKITLVHNGSLRNWRSLLEDAAQFDVDSEAVAYNLNVKGFEWTINRLHGAYALVWFDEEEQTLNFYRNSERPFWFVHTKDVIGFGSERFIVAAGLERNGFDVESFQELPAKHLVSFDCSEEGRDVVVTKFEPTLVQPTGYNVTVHTTRDWEHWTSDSKQKQTNDKAYPLNLKSRAEIGKLSFEGMKPGLAKLGDKIMCTYLPLKAVYPTFELGDIVFGSYFNHDQYPSRDGTYKITAGLLVESDLDISITGTMSRKNLESWINENTLCMGVVKSIVKHKKNGRESWVVHLGEVTATNVVDPYYNDMVEPTAWPMSTDIAEAFLAPTSAKEIPAILTQ